MDEMYSLHFRLVLESLLLSNADCARAKSSWAAKYRRDEDSGARTHLTFSFSFSSSIFSSLR